MTSRWQLLTRGATGLFAPYDARRAKSKFCCSEVQRRIVRHDFRGLTKEDLGTPALILDEALFEKNLKKMAPHNRATRLKLRAHIKVHKCPEIAKRQVALGGIGGVGCATTAECGLMGARRLAFEVNPPFLKLVRSWQPHHRCPNPSLAALGAGESSAWAAKRGCGLHSQFSRDGALSSCRLLRSRDPS
jgi:hypothetical protein